jgi:hypothetical protein
MFLNQVQGFAGLPAAFQGVLRIAAGAGTGISVVGLRGRFNERKDFLITTTPTVNEDDTASAQETAFPHFVDSGGYTTQFILLSGVKDQAASGKMRFFSQTGEPLLLHFR